MRAVWSFWSKPYLSERKSLWVSEKHHWLSWVLSLETAKRHYPVTCLLTDSYGADLLVGKLGLNFAFVSTELDKLADEDPQWWALGKLYAYSVQQEPFVHIDSDVYLWKSLPASLAAADVFSQNPEFFSEVGDAWYQPECVDQAFMVEGGWLPLEWQWYRRLGGAQRAECCGILGGCRTDFLRHYAEQALQFAMRPDNEKAWRGLGDKAHQMTLVEQYMLTACLEFHNAHEDSAGGTLQMAYLFDSLQNAYDPESSTRLGYTHLIANAKKNPRIAVHLEQRVRRDFPESFRRCAQW